VHDPAGPPPEPGGQGVDRRAQLLALAAELFAERGYGGTRISDIARAAGVAKGLLYWYFPSKEALLAAVGDDVVRGLRKLQGAAIAGLDDALERLYVGVLVTIRYADRHYQLYGALNTTGSPAPDSVLVRGLARHVSDTVVVLEDGQRRGTVRADERADELAHAISAMVNQLLHFHQLGMVCGSLDDLAALAARLCVHLAAADPVRAVAVADAHDALARRAAAHAS